MTSEALGRFGHHPDVAIDYCVEVEFLEGLWRDVKAGIEEKPAFELRLTKALSFQAGGDVHAVSSMHSLRRLAREVDMIDTVTITIRRNRSTSVNLADDDPGTGYEILADGRSVTAGTYDFKLPWKTVGEAFSDIQARSRAAAGTE